MEINNKYSLGEIVYIRTDTDQAPAQVTRIIVMPMNSLIYGLTHKGIYITSDEFELSRERDVMLATGGVIMERNEK
jgi:hypothetical protein